MRTLRRLVPVALVASLLAACASPQGGGNDAPLSFVPADTAYLYANLEPMPAAVTEQWSKKMHDYWPAVFGTYQSLLNDAKDLDDRHRRIVAALLDEIKTRDSWDKLRELGLKPDARVAFYGIGLVPVMRLELGDPAALRAAVARIEQKVGDKLPVARTGSQEYWQVGGNKLVGAIAIEGSHLVITVLPANASDALKQTLLGVTRPAQNIGAAGTLQALAKQHHYSPFGEGFLDTSKLVERLTAPSGTDQEFAKLLDLPIAATDATCRGEYLQIAHTFPRLLAGIEDLTPQHMGLAAQLEIEAKLAADLIAALPAAPGTGTPGQGIIDFSVSLPVLKLKDFWIKQADAIAAKPYTCASLMDLNEGYRSSKSKVDVTVPPPFSDLTGARFTLTRATANPNGMPDFAGRMLMGSNNPLAALAMAQLVVPQLKDLKLASDGKPVPIPAGLVPMPTPPLFAAMSNKAIAIAAGAGEDAALGEYLKAPAADTSVFMRIYFSGAIYGLMTQYSDTMKSSLPADKQASFAAQSQVFAIYEKWLRSAEISFIAAPDGIVVRESVSMNN